MQVLILFTLGMLVVDALRRDDWLALAMSSTLFVSFVFLLLWLGGLL